MPADSPSPKKRRHFRPVVTGMPADFSALRQCGARPGELCQATIADIDRAAKAIILREQKTARKTRKPRRIAIGRKLGDLLAQAIGDRQTGPIFLSHPEDPDSIGTGTL